MLHSSGNYIGFWCSTATNEQNTETVEIKTTEEEKSEKKESTGEAFVEAAEQGEGITHLARKALKNYLAEGGNGLELLAPSINHQQNTNSLSPNHL